MVPPIKPSSVTKLMSTNSEVMGFCYNSRDKSIFAMLVIFITAYEVYVFTLCLYFRSENLAISVLQFNQEDGAKPEVKTMPFPENTKSEGTDLLLPIIELNVIKKYILLAHTLHPVDIVFSRERAALLGWWVGWYVCGGAETCQALP